MSAPIKHLVVGDECTQLGVVFDDGGVSSHVPLAPSVYVGLCSG